MLNIVRRQDRKRAKNKGYIPDQLSHNFLGRINGSKSSSIDGFWGFRTNCPFIMTIIPSFSIFGFLANAYSLLKNIIINCKTQSQLFAKEPELSRLKRSTLAKNKFILTNATYNVWHFSKWTLRNLYSYDKLINMSEHLENITLKIFSWLNMMRRVQGWRSFVYLTV